MCDVMCDDKIYDLSRIKREIRVGCDEIFGPIKSSKYDEICSKSKILDVAHLAIFGGDLAYFDLESSRNEAEKWIN